MIVSSDVVNVYTS